MARRMIPVANPTPRRFGWGAMAAAALGGAVVAYGVARFVKRPAATAPATPATPALSATSASAATARANAVSADGLGRVDGNAQTQAATGLRYALDNNTRIDGFLGTSASGVVPSTTQLQSTGASLGVAR